MPKKLAWETIVLGQATVIDTNGPIGKAYVLYFQSGRITISDVFSFDGKELKPDFYSVEMGDEFNLAVYSRIIQ